MESFLMPRARVLEEPDSLERSEMLVDMAHVTSQPKKWSLYLSTQDTLEESNRLELKKAKDDNRLRKICVHNDWGNFEMNETFATALIDLFQQMSRGKRGLELSLINCLQNEHFQSVLDFINTNQLLEVLETYDQNMMHSIHRYMEINKHLRVLKFKGNRREPSFCVNSATLLGDALRSTKTLESLSFGFFQMPSISLSSINSATATNKSLRKLHFVDCQLEDNQIAEVIKCITDHKTIEELDISRNRCKDKGLRALVQLLSSTDCKLTVLILSSLNLSTSDVDLLLCTLWEGHSLEELDVSRNEISSLDFGNYLEEPRPSRLRRLLLKGNPFEKDSGEAREQHCQHLYKILKTNRELSDLDSFRLSPLRSLLWDSAMKPQIQHLLDMNRMGCVLLGKYDFPLSVWPRVFERTNLILQDHTTRRANAIFHLLRSQAGLFF